MKRVILLGPPGSGKGTQAARLAGELGVPAISTGEMLRRAAAAGTELGKRVEGIMLLGHLVDDDTMAEVVRERLAQEDARQGFLLDGYPRTLPQAETLESILETQGVGLDAVVLIEVPEPVLFERLLARKRPDDSEGVIRERLRVYREDTEPLAGFYRRQGLLTEVDGNQPIENVAAALLAALGR